MELEKVRCSTTEVVLLINDPTDEDTCDFIREKLTDNNILCRGLYDTPGEQILQVFVNLAPVVKKAVFLFSHSSSINKGLQYLMSMVIFGIAKENIITVFTPYEKPLVDELKLLQQTIVIRTDSESWLDDLVSELTLMLPRYTQILSKGNLIDSLMFQGLCIQHMQTDILGVLVVADKLCLQIDLNEYLKYQDRHQVYKTPKVLEEFRCLRNINSSVVIIVKQKERQKALKSVKEDIGAFAASVIDTSLALARCDWSVACTVKGKFQADEQKFLSDIYPCISYTLMNTFIESIKEPILPQFESVQDRIESYPQTWKQENFESVESMSTAGFLYAGFGETGRCFHCGCVLTNIRQQGLPLVAHAARYPTCSYAKSNLTDEEITEAITGFKNNDEKSKIAEAVKEKFQNLDIRIKTFESYESKNGRTDIDICKVAEAGFYYIGLENIVQCFQCSVRFYGIPTDQSPWSMHASLSPTCAYVIKEKGECFIKELQTAKDQTLNSDYTVITFIRKTCDSTKRREWPKNLFRPW
ncbi:baculoviral IAP repeat-containing protein 2/3 [Mytilus galloprovincialis]|uniref:Baculoviral IAP repeat-containing protein 2/3 n=1 Tax=Mytilus galloprovincialis TaxID=29158 RepID=A0A8B6GGZ2_MYTGA|nr:baculoviral IAP repeat-containing protein 2/3 [Mytilus galloprovincialis]